MATKIQLLKDLGSDVLNLIELGFLKPDSAKNPSAVKSAQTKYEKSLKASPAVRRREEQRLSGDTEFSGIDFGERNIVGIEGLLGSTLVPIFGDKTAIGAVNQLKGLKLDSPIESHGGVNFSQQHQGSGRGWMSMERAAKGKQSNIDFAADRTNNNDVVGVYTAGADPSFSFAAPTAELMMAQTLAAKVPKKSKATFDAELRSVRPDWVGLDDPRALDQLLGKGEFAREGSGALRIDFVDTMDKAKYRDMGFGIRQDAVNAITQPGLENVARGDSGFGLMQAVPGAKTFGEEGIHQSYDTVIPGDYRGGLVDSLPANVMFPDTFRWMQGLGRKPSSQLGSLMMDPKLYQRADENWLESVSRYLETGIPDVPIKSAIPAAGALGLLAAPDDAGAMESPSVRSALEEAGVIGDTLVPTKRPLGERAMGVVDRILSGLEAPQRGLQGLAATGYGLLSGEDFDTAAFRGADVVTQGVDESARQFGDYVFDMTGSPAAAAAAYTSGILGSPL